MWSSKSQREQYFKEQRVLNVDSKIKKREDGKWPLYIETWKTLLPSKELLGEAVLFVCSRKHSNMFKNSEKGSTHS